MKRKNAPRTNSKRESVAELVEGLASKRPAQREKTRKQIVKIGHAAVIPLLHKLTDPAEHVRWEAAKALAEIADPAAADALVDALGDGSSDVRWVAGEALIALGWEGAKHVLVRLLRQGDSTDFCCNAHQVLSVFAKRRSGRFLKPVLEGLRGYEPGVNAPPAALIALKSLRKAAPIK